MTLQKLLANFRLFANTGKVGNKIVTTLSAISQRIVREEGYSLEKRFSKDFMTSCSGFDSNSRTSESQC